jgi:hypothetical protein
MIEVLLQNKNVICELDNDIPVLRHRWLKEPTSSEFREGLLAMQKIYLEHKLKFENLKWLADTEHLGELNEDDENWLTSEWDRKIFMEAGVKVHAVILGDSIFADYPMEVFKKSSARKYEEMGVKLDVFANETNAYKWLKEN